MRFVTTKVDYCVIICGCKCFTCSVCKNAASKVGTKRLYLNKLVEVVPWVPPFAPRFIPFHNELRKIFTVSKVFLFYIFTYCSVITMIWKER